MTREEAVAVIQKRITARYCSVWEKISETTFWAEPDEVNEALDMAISARREQEERSKKCPYCDVAKANEGVRNTVLHVKEPETNKWTMMGKKLLFCPMCGRRLEEKA